MSDLNVQNPGALKDIISAASNGGGGLTGMAAVAARADANRPVYYFAVPEKMADVADGITKIGLVKMRPDEEVLASEMAGNSQAKAGMEAIKMSLRVVVRGDMRTVCAVHDGSADRQFGAMDPRLRSLVLNAYTHIHQAKPDEVKDFLDSCEIAVG